MGQYKGMYIDDSFIEVVHIVETQHDLHRCFYWCASKSEKHIDSLFLVMAHRCFFIGLEAPVLHDPCAPVF